MLPVSNPRATLRSPSGDDAAFFEGLNALPDVARFIGSARPQDRWDVRVIEVDRHAVGIVSVGPSDYCSGEFLELVCAMTQAARGRGFAVSACHLMLMEMRTARRGSLIACVDRDNVAGRRLLERLGARFLRPRQGTRSGEDVFVFD